MTKSDDKRQKNIGEVKMIVENIRTPAGNRAVRQFIIRDNSVTYFQSYCTIIAKRDNFGRVYLDQNFWDYSMTTGKYRNIFLHETKRETEKKIKSGQYILTNLN